VYKRQAIKTITSNSRIRPVLVADGRVSPSISANANIVLFDKVWKTQADFDTGVYNNTKYDVPSETLQLDGAILGTWTVDFDSGFNDADWNTLGWINLLGGGSVKARIKSAPSQAELTTAPWYGYYTDSFQDIGVPNNKWIRIELTLETASDPYVSSLGVSYDEFNNPLQHADARIRPVITGRAEVSVPFTQTIPANGSIVLPSNLITGSGFISLPKTITANAMIQPSITARALVVDRTARTIDSIARVLRDTTTRLFISSDIKENILMYDRYQDLRGLVVDENYYTRDGHIIPRKRGRTLVHSYLFAVQSPLHPDTIWSVYLNNSYQYHILTDAVGITPFRLFLDRGRNRVDVVRKATDSQVMQINPTTRVNLIPFESNSSTVQEETFILRNIDGSIIRLENSEYSFIDAHHVQIASSAYDSTAIYTIYYSVLENQAQEVWTKKYSAWVNALNYVTWFGAYSEEMMLVDDSIEETRGNTYIREATHQGLEQNFGEVFIKTSPDPKWSVEGYRELIEEYFHSYHRSSITYKGVKDGVGNISTIPPKIESYRTYKKWVLGWQFLPNRDLIVDTLSGKPAGWLVTGGTSANPSSPAPKFGDSHLEVTATGGESVVLELSLIHISEPTRPY